MSDLPKGGPLKKRSPLRREHAGWLMLFCVVSLLLHLGAGLTSRTFDFGMPKMLATPPPAEVEISLAPLPAPPALGTVAPATKPADAPQTKASPAPQSEQSAQIPRQSPTKTQRALPEPARSVPQIPRTPTEKPTTAPAEASAPRAVAPIPDRVPEPLPLGVRTGQKDVTEAAPAPSPQPLPGTEPTPLTATPPPTRLQIKPSDVSRPQSTPNNEPTLPSVRVPTAAERPPLNAVPTPAPKLATLVPKPTPVPAPTAPSAKPTVAASPVEAGPFGLTRGVPFGERLGVPRQNPSEMGGGNPFAPGFRLHMNPVKTDNTPPIHIVYVLDTSLSMADDKKIERAQKALEKALSELRTDDTFNIVPFSDRARLMFPSMSKVTNFTVAGAESNIEFLTPDGDTNLSDAIDLALAQKEVSHIFVMSDGTPTKGIIEFDELLEHVKERNTNNVRINALALGLGEKFDGMKLLRSLAEQNGGKFDYINLRGR